MRLLVITVIFLCVIMLYACEFKQIRSTDVYYGMTKTELYQKHGFPAKSTNTRDTEILFYPAYSIWVGYDWQRTTTLYFRDEKLYNWLID